VADRPLPETPLLPALALGGIEPRQAFLDAGTATLRLSETVVTALVGIAARRGQLPALEVAAMPAGLPALPGPGGLAGDAVGAFVLWSGPGQWLASTPDPDLAAILRGGLPAGAASVTDQTDAFVRIDAEGPGLMEVLARLAPLDPAALPRPGASRTLIEHQGVVVLLWNDGHAAFLGPRPSAGTLWHGLETAARSVAAQAR